METTKDKTIPENTASENTLKKTEDKFDSEAYIAKAEETAKQEENKKSEYYDYGIKCIFISLIVLAVSILYYLYTGKIWQNDIKSTFEGMFIGAGFFGSLAGLLLVLDNLTLQRKSLIKQSLDLAYTRVEVKQSVKELEEANKYYKAQNELMTNQQKENTFYRLIEMQKKMYEDINSRKGLFDTLFEVIKEQCVLYRACVNENRFPDFISTRNIPTFYNSRFNQNKSDYFEMYIDNVKDIVSFIHNNFDAPEIYNNKFYNQLFPNEKYLVGMCQELRMYGFYDEIKDGRYLYNKYYNSLGNESYRFTNGYYPAIGLDVQYVNPDTIVRLEKDIYFFKVSEYQNIFGNDIILDKLIARVLVGGVDVFPNPTQVIDSPVIFKDGELKIDMLPVFKTIDSYCKTNRVGSIQGGYSIHYFFNFIYDSNPFTVTFTQDLYINSYGELKSFG